MAGIAKTKRAEAERAAEWFLREHYKCTHTRRALRTKYAKVDFFGCDVMGSDPCGMRYWVQVTTGKTQKARERRKKLDKYDWNRQDIVMVLQLVERQDIRRPARKQWFFRGWQRLLSGRWIEKEIVIEIPRRWFKAYKEGNIEQED